MDNRFEDYDVLREKYEDGRISAVEFVTLQDEVVTDDYRRFCASRGLDPSQEASAIAFMDYREKLFEDNIGS